MANWNEPKDNYQGGDEVTPEIFNNLAANEKYLKGEKDKHDTRLTNVEGRATNLEKRATAVEGRAKGLEDRATTLETNKIETGDVQNANVDITQATTRTNLGTRESIKSLFGKIKKWFAELKALAFKDKVTETDISGTISTDKISGLHSVATSGSYADLNNKPDISKSAIGLGNVANERQYSSANPPPYPVTKVAGKTGEVTLGKGDVGLGNVINEKQYCPSNPPPHPVTSVAGKTGAVALAKGDVGLGNVLNEKQYCASNAPPYPVSSVAGKTGAVTLAKGDVGLGNVANERQYSDANPGTKVKVGNTTYTLRTGTSGAAGYITFVL